MARTTYEVIVGNVGRVYNGTSKREADKVYHDYIEISRSGHGRAGGEEVTLFVDGDFADCYSPVHDEDDDDYGGRMNNPSGGSDYEIYESDIPDQYSVVYVGDPKGRYRLKTIQSNGYGYEGGIKPIEYARIKKRNRRLSLSDLPPVLRAVAEKYMGTGRTANPRKKGSAVYDSTLSITSSPMFYTPNVFRSVMNDAQFKPVPKWCKSVLDAMNIPPAVAKELLSGKRGYKINDERETVEIPMTAAELDEAVAMSKRR
jgi:hypothetical protein